MQYIFFQKINLASHNEANVKIDFIVQNLFLLEKSLSELNIPLTIVQSDGFKEDPILIKDLSLKRNIDKVYWNKQFGEDESNRDSIALDLLEKKQYQS
jgi:deoxyribodipyrimidine photo-lyase